MSLIEEVKVGSVIVVEDECTLTIVKRVIKREDGVFEIQCGDRWDIDTLREDKKKRPCRCERA